MSVSVKAFTPNRWENDFDFSDTPSSPPPSFLGLGVFAAKASLFFGAGEASIATGPLPMMRVGGLSSNLDDDALACLFCAVYRNTAPPSTPE